MATVRCKSCSNLVAFRGKTAVCPKCGNGLRIPSVGDLLDLGENADPNIGPAQPTLVAEYGRTRATTVKAARNNNTLVTVVLGLGVFGALLMGGLVALWWYLSRPNSTVTPTPTPAGPVVTAPPSAPSPAPPTPQPATPSATVPPPPTTLATVPERKWTPLIPLAPTVSLNQAVTDERLEPVIRKGVEFLLSRFDGPTLKDLNETDSISAGRNALALYALIAAGKELGDASLDLRTPQMRERLDRLKKLPGDGDHEVYSRSVRMQAMSLANRTQDRTVMETDLRWMLRAGVGGAFGYVAAKPGDTRETMQGGWDASCSQYGLLGVWAMSSAGLDTPQSFWASVEQHWRSTQDPVTGGWSYRDRPPSLAMTTAGVNALVVAGDQLGNDRSIKGRDPFATRVAIARGLDFMAKENRIAEAASSGHIGYTVYGVERVGLATGYKFIGDVDWFKTIASSLIKSQGPDGSWKGFDTATVDTAFVVLFLVRGRPPVMLAKLRYPPDLLDIQPPKPTAANPNPLAAYENTWQRYPRDVANLAFYATQKTERQLNWQVVDIRQSWREWLDAPILMLSGDKPLKLDDRDIDNFREYIAHGGLLFTQTDNDSEEFTQFAGKLASQLVPGKTLEPLPPTHPVYSTVFKPQPDAAPIPLMGIGNGNRLVMIHSPGNISSRWLRRLSSTQQQNLELGLNMFVYAAGRGVGRNRTDSPVLPEPNEKPVATFTVAHLVPDNATSDVRGLWMPEPAAWPRAARGFELATRLHADIKPLSPAQLPSPLDLPLALITVPPSGSVELGERDLAALRKWVQAGGVLLIDSVGGGQKAADTASALARRVTGSSTGEALGPSDPLLSGLGYQPFARDISKVRLSDFAIQERGGKLPAPRLAKAGKGAVILSEIDLTTALLSTNIYGVVGYTPQWAMGFANNLLLGVANGTVNQPGPQYTPPASSPPASSPPSGQ